MGRVRLVMLTKLTGVFLLIRMLVMMEGQHKRHLQHDRQQQDCYYSAYMLQLPHRGTKIQRKLIILPCLSVKPIDEGLDLEQPFKESEVRDSECLVAEAWLLLTAGILLLPPPLRGRPGGLRPRFFIIEGGPSNSPGRDSPARLAASPFGRPIGLRNTLPR